LLKHIKMEPDNIYFYYDKRKGKKKKENRHWSDQSMMNKKNKNEIILIRGKNNEYCTGIGRKNKLQKGTLQIINKRKKKISKINI